MVALVLCGVLAQAPVPAFEAASVHRSPESAPRQSEIHVDPAGFAARNYRLKFLIPWAYKIAVYQLGGEPSWLDENTYDINGRAPAGSSEEQIRFMVQALLDERFRLKFHREQRDLPAYALVLAKDGPKLQIEKRQPGAPVAAPPEQTSLPSIFAALQEQLGLKLVPRRTSMEIFIIDHIEPVPTEN